MSLHDTKWADIEADDDFEQDFGSSNLAGFETAPDKLGIKTVTSYGKNSAGQTIKIVRKVKVNKRIEMINKAVSDRANMPHFGSVQRAEAPITPLEEFVIEMPKERKQLHKMEEEPDDNRFELNLKPIKEAKMRLRQIRGEAFKDLDKPAVDTKEKHGRYVPTRYKKDKIMDQQKEECTVRVTNLSEDVTEQDLKELFGRVGPIVRVFVAKNKETKYSKGFGFITFKYKHQAADAIRRLNRHGYDNLLLNVEWAKPSVQK